MMIRLRPHHLLCMLTFAGKGYTPEFIVNLERIIDLIAAGNQTVEIVFGPDDICAPLLGGRECHCNNPSIAERDRVAAEALINLLKRPICSNATVHLMPDAIQRMRIAFAEGTTREACRGCQWSKVCDAIAEDSFRASRLICG